MKCFPLSSAAIGLFLFGCENFNRPISSGDFDPLRPPGSNTTVNVNSGPTYKAGQFVRAAMNNTAFFNNRPRGEADADKILQSGTSMKVISLSDSYLKVELDSGEVGFVPTVMVEDASSGSTVPTGNPGEYQVYPPLNGFGAPPPVMPQGELPPEGAIPTVIDPEAPVSDVPIPPVNAPTEAFPAPVETPAPGPAPLPPNQDDIEAMRKAGQTPPEPSPDPIPKLEE